MIQVRKIIVSILFLLPFSLFAQVTSDAKTKFVGKWLMVKHTLTEKGKTDNLLTSNETYIFNFTTDGSYEVSYTNKKNASTTVYKGKWQIVSSGKKLKLYDNTLPTEPQRLVGDRLLPIIKITGTEFVTKELLFGMDLLGTSYYKKQ